MPHGIPNMVRHIYVLWDPIERTHHRYEVIATCGPCGNRTKGYGHSEHDALAMAVGHLATLDCIDPNTLRAEDEPPPGETLLELEESLGS